MPSANSSLTNYFFAFYTRLKNFLKSDPQPDFRDTIYPFPDTIKEFGVEVIHENGQTFKIHPGEKITEPLWVTSFNSLTLKPFIPGASGGEMLMLKARQWTYSVPKHAYLQCKVDDCCTEITVHSTMAAHPYPEQPEELILCFEAIDVKNVNTWRVEIPVIHHLSTS